MQNGHDRDVRDSTEVERTEIRTTGDDRDVYTTRGIVKMSECAVSEVRERGGNHESIAREYHIGNELVRRDAWVTILRGESAQPEQGKLG